MIFVFLSFESRPKKMIGFSPHLFKQIVEICSGETIDNIFWGDGVENP